MKTIPGMVFAAALALPVAAAAQSEFPLYTDIVEGGMGAPVPSINLVIVQDGMELAADTTDAAGFAEFPAGEAGEHSVALQDPVPVHSLLLVIAGRREWTSDVGPNFDVEAVEVAAEAGEMVQAWLIAYDDDYIPEEPGVPVERAAPPIEETHAAADAEAGIEPDQEN